MLQEDSFTEWKYVGKRWKWCTERTVVGPFPSGRGTNSPCTKWGASPSLCLGPKWKTPWPSNVEWSLLGSPNFSPSHAESSPWGQLHRLRRLGARKVTHTRENSDSIRWKWMGSELKVGFDDQALDFAPHNPPLCFLSAGKDSPVIDSFSRPQEISVGKKNPEGLSNWVQKIWGGESGQQKLLGQHWAVDAHSWTSTHPTFCHRSGPISEITFQFLGKNKD